MTTQSWILEARSRLASPPPRSLSTEGPRHAALVPLFVDGGDLWVLLRRPPEEGLVPGRAVFPATPLDGDEPWAGIEQAAGLLPGLDANTLLRLGRLDDVSTVRGDVVVPCVGAIPTLGEVTTGNESDLAPLPLVAARIPQLIEERSSEVAGEEVWFRVVHIGPVKLADAEAEILDNLLARLFSG